MKTKGVVMREGGMSGEAGGGGRRICVPQMDFLRLVKKWEEVSSGEARNSLG